jgi:thymidylate kinase
VLPPPVTYLYMGVNPESSNLLLPTTRLVHAVRRARGATPDAPGPRDSRRPDRTPPRSRAKRSLRSARSFLRLANRLAEEWQRALVASVQRRRGSIVIFDRHFFADYYAYDVAPPTARRPLSSRIHGILLQHAYPKPDLAVFLDAPAAVLYARKPEATVEWLERRREEYVRMRDVLPNFARVDASGPADEVAREVARVIIGFHEARTRREHGPGAPKDSA